MLNNALFNQVPLNSTKILQGAGSVAASASVAGVQTKARYISGAVGASASLTGGQLRKRYQGGAVSASATVSGAQTAMLYISGAVTASATLSGTIYRVRYKAGAITTSAAVSGTLQRRRYQGGGVAASASVSGAGLLLKRFLEGAVSVSAVVSSEQLKNAHVLAPYKRVVMVEGGRKAQSIGVTFNGGTLNQYTLNDIASSSVESVWLAKECRVIAVEADRTVTTEL